MQIFILDRDPKVCAEMHVDKHCIKQILESCQLLCTTLRANGVDYGYGATHKNHPCRIWTGKSKANFYWLKDLGLALCSEYTHRYGKVHKSQEVLENLPDLNIKDVGLTPFAQAMPDEYKDEDIVKAYRSYYLGAKSHILTYTNREPPDWLKGIAKYKEKVIK